MKRENRRAIVFVLMAVLVFPCFTPHAAALEDEPQATESISPAQKMLKDIKGHWGEEAIQKALDYGFIEGYSDGSFRPDKPVRRAEFVRMMNKALKLREENTLELFYSDVKDSDWFYDDIRKASYAGYIKGINETAFMPAKEITRQEAAVILARILPNAGAFNDVVLNGYKDADRISSWAKSAVALAVSKGYLNGYGHESLRPKATLSRAEAAKIIGMILGRETIIREDISVKSPGETLEGKICVGDILIERSVGEGDAALENITALSRVYVLGGGTQTITVSNSTIIQLIVCKEGPGVRVLSDAGTIIYYAFVFNGGLLADSGGQTAGNGSHYNIIRLNGNVSAETAIRIADAIAERLDSSGQITQDQLKAALSAVAEGFEIFTDSNGNLAVNLPENIQLIISHSGSNTVYITVNGKPAAISAMRGSGSCGLPLTSPGAFTKTITFYPSSDAASPVTAFVIETEAQLQHLALHPDSNAFLMNDLDFSQYATGSGDPSAPMGALKLASQAGLYSAGYDISDFEAGKFVPIGADSHTYSGTFYGNGKVISGLEVSGGSADNAGLFGCTSGAEISGLTISGGSITGAGYIGSVIGEARGGTTIENCVNSAAVTGLFAVGGLVGVNDDSSILNSGNAGAVSGDYYAGGAAGINYGVILDSGNTGTISGFEDIGGIAGFHNGNTADIENCFNTGAVSGLLDIGGVAGYAYDGSAVKNSYNTGAVSGNDHVGGITGSNYNNTVLNSYNTGIYSGDNHAGSPLVFVPARGNCRRRPQRPASRIFPETRYLQGEIRLGNLQS